MPFDTREVCVEIRTMFLFRRNAAEKAATLRSRAGEPPQVQYLKSNKHISIGGRVFIECRPRRKAGGFTVGFNNADSTRYYTHESYDEIGDAKIAAVAIYEALNVLRA